MKILIFIGLLITTLFCCPKQTKNPNEELVRNYVRTKLSLAYDSIEYISDSCVEAYTPYRSLISLDYFATSIYLKLNDVLDSINNARSYKQKKKIANRSRKGGALYDYKRLDQTLKKISLEYDLRNWKDSFSFSEKRKAIDIKIRLTNGKLVTNRLYFERNGNSISHSNFTMYNKIRKLSKEISSCWKISYKIEKYIN